MFGDTSRNELMINKIDKTFKKIDTLLRPASLAQVGGFRPPDDPVTSWFGGRGVGLTGEVLPKYKGRDMFCLLQVKISELPFVPMGLENTKFLVVFFNREDFPFDRPHGDGWVIREYQSLDELALLPSSSESDEVRSFPVRWSLIDDDAPGWEDAWDLLDMTPINESEDATNEFYDRYNGYPHTKFGGYPFDIQYGVGLDGYVFQIGSEEKAGWMWGDSGIAYFHKIDGEWKFDMQCY